MNFHDFQNLGPGSALPPDPAATSHFEIKHETEEPKSDFNLSVSLLVSSYTRAQLPYTLPACVRRAYGGRTVRTARFSLKL